ncbi:conserved hypothetical protein [Streptomyces clavuligerus]|nr:conserved hypothetical protein [Streptomyces clavuligerus]
MPGAARRTGPPRYWHRHVGADGAWRKEHTGGPPGEDLAALRAGLGKPAGTVPSLWQHYTSRTDGRPTPELEAEHGALSLYGLHQQSRRRPMHRPGVGLGEALRRLRQSGGVSADALDRRTAAAVNATSVPALLYRLRGLIPQLRSAAIPLDYDQLLRDLRNWAHPESRQRVRRTWGLAYHTDKRDVPEEPVPSAPDPAGQAPAPATTATAPAHRAPDQETP